MQTSIGLLRAVAASRWCCCIARHCRSGWRRLLWLQVRVGSMDTPEQDAHYDGASPLPFAPLGCRCCSCCRCCCRRALCSEVRISNPRPASRAAHQHGCCLHSAPLLMCNPAHHSLHLLALAALFSPCHATPREQQSAHSARCRHWRAATRGCGCPCPSSVAVRDAMPAVCLRSRPAVRSASLFLLPPPASL